MDRVKIRVIPNDVLLERGDNIAASALLQYARLLADHLERCANVPFGEHFGEPPGRIIIGRQQVILCIEPENNIDRSIRGACADSESEYKREDEANEHRSGFGFHIVLMTEGPGEIQKSVGQARQFIGVLSGIPAPR